MSHKVQWQVDLFKLQKRYLGGFPDLTQDDTKKVQQVLDEFRKSYPGNFSLRWRYEPITGLMVLWPKFDRPEEETFWKLKYSS